MLYALAGLYDEERGWGIRGEGFVAADAAGAWFRVGDRDLALCRERAGWLDAGVGRAEVARRLCERLGVAALVVPATAEACRTEVLVAAGAPGSGAAGAATGGVSGLPLQEWLVRERAALPPLGLRVVPPAPRATQEAVAAVEGAELVVLGPSSPLMSLLPLLAAPELAAAVARAPRVVALSPTVRAIAPRTPAEVGRYRVRGLLLEARGSEHSASGVARFWGGALDGFVLDHADGAEAAGITVPTLAADVLAPTGAARSALATAVVEFGLGLPARSSSSPVRVLPEA